MIPLITPMDMRAMEQRYFAEANVRSIDLMETAARALCDALLGRWGHDKTVYFACGPGGNGGDGYACARMYRQAGGRACVIAASEPTSADARENLRRAREAGVGEAGSEAPDIWVDALYGTGLSRAPGGPSAELIQRMNADRARGAAVVAVDIPSGLNGLTGQSYAPCVRADLTCTFQFAKPGCHLADGLDAAGKVVVLDIGIPAAFHPDGGPALVDAGEVRRVLPPRPRNFHKGRAGHLLVVAGSFGMAGAAALCAKAALAAGAGLVTIACPASVVPMLQVLVPCAMCVPLPEREGAMAGEAVPVLEKLLAGKTGVACGCGLSRRASPEVVATVLKCGLPALLDADALNLISEDAGLRSALRPHHLLTPHPGEAARLLGRPMEVPIADALALNGMGCQALLKGAATVIPVGGQPLISRSGCSGMAKGGSGDCLSGIIGGLMVQQGPGLDGDALALCAAVGSELHGIAGEIACQRRGVRSMDAMDIIDALPEALARYG